MPDRRRIAHLLIGAAATASLALPLPLAEPDDRALRLRSLRVAEPSSEAALAELAHAGAELVESARA